MADNKIEFLIEAKDKFSSAFGALNRSVTSLSAIVTGFAAGALVRATTNALEFGSTIKDTADRVDLSTDALQEWRFVAEQSGGSAEKLDQAVGMFSRTIGQAAAGNAQYQQALARLGITLDDLNSQPFEQIFERTRNAISELGTASERNRLLMQLFGRQGKDLGNVFSETSSEVARLRGQAQELGAVMDKDTIAKAKKTKDELDAMSSVIKTQMASALIAIGPLLATMATQLANVANKTREAVGAFGHFLGLDLDTTLDEYDKLLFRQQELTEMIKRREGQGLLPRWMMDQSRLPALNAELAQVTAQLEKLREAYRQSKGGDTRQPATGFQPIDPDFLTQLKQQADASSGIKIRALENDRLNQIKKLQEMNLSQKDFKAAEYLINQDYANKVIDLQDSLYEQLGAGSDLYFKERQFQLNEDLRNMEAVGIARQEMLRYQAEQELIIEADKIRMRQEMQRQELENRLVLDQTMTETEAQIRRDALKYEQATQAQKVVMVRDAYGQMLNDLGTFNKTAFKAAQSYNIGVALMEAYKSFTITMSAYPYPVNIAFAAASLAAAMAKVNAIRSQKYSGQAHGGLENVPSEGTFLLDKGERVLAPQQNRDLTDFLESGAAGGVSVGQLNFYIDVPDSRALLDMDRNAWRDIVARNVIPALDQLEDMGIRQKAIERRRGF